MHSEKLTLRRRKKRTILDHNEIEEKMKNETRIFFFNIQIKLDNLMCVYEYVCARISVARAYILYVNYVIAIQFILHKLIVFRVLSFGVRISVGYNKY